MKQVHVGNRHYISYDPKVRKTLGIKKDEVLAGFLYLTDLEEDMPKAPRKIET